MNKTLLAEIDADVGKRVLKRMKKNQVAGLQVGALNRLAASAHGDGIVRQDDADSVAKYVRDIATTVPTGFRVRAAEVIFHAEEGKRMKHQLVGAIAPFIPLIIGGFAGVRCACRFLRTSGGR